MISDGSIEIPKISPDRLKAIWDEFPADIMSVGPEKPIGNCPIEILEYHGISPQERADALNKREGITAYLTPASTTHAAGITAFHRDALQNLLDSGENPGILQEAGWPTDAEAFVKRVDSEWADYQSQPGLCEVISRAFGASMSIAEEFAEMERESQTISHQRIHDYLENCEAGIAVRIIDSLGEADAIFMASQFTMKQLISYIYAGNSLDRYRFGEGEMVGGGKPAEFSLSPEDNGTGKSNIFPLLRHTRDFDLAGAVELLKESNNRLDKMARRRQRHVCLPAARHGEFSQAAPVGTTSPAKNSRATRNEKWDIGF